MKKSVARRENKINKKQLIIPIFVLTLLAFNLVLVSADIGSFFTTAADWFKNVTYPEGLNETPGGIFVALIGVILILIIIGDLLSLASPLSGWVNWSIAVGVTFIMLTMGTARVIIGWGMLLTTSIFGLSGLGALIGTALLFGALIIVIFIGSGPLQNWILNVKERKDAIATKKKVDKKVQPIIAGGRALRDIGENIG